MNSNPSDPLARAARRAEHQPFFLAGILATYQEAHQLDTSGLAALLACQPGDLPRLALCRRPGLEPERFGADIDHLVQRFQLDGERLSQIIRQVDALSAIQQQLHVDASSQSMLRAARDRDPSTGDDKEDKHD